MASVPASAPSSSPSAPNAEKKGWTIPRPSVSLPSRGAVLTTLALAGGAAATILGVLEKLERNKVVEARQHSEYGAAKTSMCLGEGLRAADVKGEKANIEAVCAVCKANVVRSLDTQVPWNFVSDGWNPESKKAAMQNSVSYGANLVCRSLNAKEAK